MRPSSVQVDQSRTPRARRYEYPPAGPVAEGAGEGIGAAEPAKGSAKKKAFLVLSGLLVLVAVICGIGYLVFIRDSGDPTSSTSSQDGLTDSSVVTERGGDATSPGSESPGPDSVPTEYDQYDDDLDSGGSDTSSSSAGGANSTDTTAGGSLSGASGNATANGTATASANATAPALKTVPVDPTLGYYDESIPLSVIPVAIAVLPSGKVLAWSAAEPDDFYREDRYIIGGGGTGKTSFAIWDPETSAATSLLVANTNHDMFCPGITMMPNGDLIITGGQNANRTSIYQLAKGTFVQAPDMAISRGYGSSCLLSNGKVFVLGGSWSGPADLAKDAELYDPTLGEWSNLPGIQAAFILTQDPEDEEEGRNYRADNYGMFYSWSDATVFHAGPSTTMFWFSTGGEGSALTAGTRPGGNIANANSVMYAKGKILNCGGSEAFALEEYPATNEAEVITIDKPNVQVNVRSVSPMNLARVYANGVILPDGKVFITGGATHPLEFSDEYAHYQPEIWDPATEEFTLLDATHVYGRTYHSTAALLPDGRVVTGGGGLCGSGNNGEPSLCKGPVDPNHLNIEVFNPPYLFTANGQLAARPSIKLSAGTAKHGASIQVTSSEQLMMISMIRMGSATHSTNTDQRRLELCGPFTSACTGSPVTVTIDEDPGIALAGNWMIFGVNAKGVPSEAAILMVGTI